MKVLFIGGGNQNGLPPLIKAQGESLKKCGIIVDYYPITGQGVRGYLRNVPKLKQYLKNSDADIIHAHYSFSGVVASLANIGIGKPVVVSLLGSDVNGDGFFKKVINRSIPLFAWSDVIVKSKEMSDKIGNIETHIIPNGVNTDLFKPLDSEECKKKLNWDLNKKHILFSANPDRPEKNFKLTEQAVQLLKNYDIVLHYLNNIEHSDIPVWMNAADVVVLSSLWEGSPNVVKEAMVCNKPIVATDVGDIEWLFGDLPGHFLTDFGAEDFAAKIKSALSFVEKYEKTKGRERILELGLDSKNVAKQINCIYKSILGK